MLLTSAFLLSLAVVPDAAEQSAKPESEKKICKAVTSTGSRMARDKICKTKAEWDAARKIDLEDARKRGSMPEATSVR
jgi:hypothetical protein